MRFKHLFQTHGLGAKLVRETRLVTQPPALVFNRKRSPQPGNTGKRRAAVYALFQRMELDNIQDAAQAEAQRPDGYASVTSVNVV